MKQIFDSGGHLGSCAADVRTLDKIRIGMGAPGLKHGAAYSSYLNGPSVSGIHSVKEKAGSKPRLLHRTQADFPV
jgi:hypothetical protein